MCGICGFIPRDPRQPVHHDLIAHMTAFLRHRGPDSEGFYVKPGVGLGVRRLAIVDVEGGDQPIANEDGSIVLVCNGEIYNYPELRPQLLASGHRFRTNTDVEAIVHLYEDYHLEFLHHLRGMFALALWDDRRRLLILARDRFGIKPLHYAPVAEGLFFGSEVKAILASGQITPRIDVHGLKDIFKLGFVLTPRTLAEGISRLPAGHYLTYHQGRLNIQPYWEINFPPAEEYNYHRRPDEWAEALREKLAESVRLHLQSDVPLGAWLSGGIDSSSVVSLMNQVTQRTVQTFSIHFEHPDYDEFHRQKTLEAYWPDRILNHSVLCRAPDFWLYPLNVWHNEGMVTGAVGIPQLLLSQLSSRKVKVVLTGEGSDEIFGGYLWYLADKLSRPFSYLPLTLRRLLARLPLLRWNWPMENPIILAPREMNLSRFAYLVGPPQMPGLQDQLFSPHLKEKLGKEDNPEVYPPLPHHFMKWHPFVQLQFYDLKVRLSDLIVHHLDYVSMAYSLEARVPFLDHPLVEFCASIPPSLKMSNFREKYILRRAMRGLLPEEIRRRRKQPLGAPVHQWLREEIPEFVREMLSAKRLRENGYFNPAEVFTLLRQHRAHKGHYSRLLLGVLAIQLWHDLFVRGWPPTCPGQDSQRPG